MPGSVPTAKVRKLLAAGWFAGFALLASGAFFFPLLTSLPPMVLYLLLPCISGGISGYFWGESILDSSKSNTYADSLLRGLVVTAAAYVIFAILFAVGIPLSETLWSLRQARSLFLMTITLGFLMVGPFMLVAGALAAVALHRFRSYAFRKGGID